MLPPTMSASEAAAAAATTIWTTTACDGNSTSTDNASTEYPSSASPDQSDKIANAIWIYMGPVIFFVGLVGNILILLVVSTKRMRGTSTSDYLLIMAGADLLAIVTGMVPEWLEAMEIFTLQESHPAACKIYKFINYSFGDAAIWIRVLFTLDRFVAICFPMKKTDCCLPQRAKFYCLGAALAAFAKNMNQFWTRGAEYTTVPVFETVDCATGMPTNQTVTNLVSNCGYPTPEYRYFEIYVRPWIVFALVNLIPFLVILICNIFIVRAMVQMKRRRLQRHLSTTKSGGERHLLQTTAMCLAASFTFLVCVTPTMVLLIGKPYWTTVGQKNVAYDIAKSISNQLQYVNNSANFFLYCITGQKFRETLVIMLRCRMKEEEEARRSKRDSSSAAVRPATVRSGAARIPRTNPPFSSPSGGSIADVINPTHPPPTSDRNYSSSSSSSSSADVTCYVTSSSSSIAVSVQDVAAAIFEEEEEDDDDDDVGAVERQKEMEENERTLEEDAEVFVAVHLGVVDEIRHDTDVTFEEPWLTESESSSGISSSGSKDASPEVAETQPRSAESVNRTLEDEGYSNPEGEAKTRLHSDYDAAYGKRLKENSNSEISENSIELIDSKYSPNSSESQDLTNSESVNQRGTDSAESLNHESACREQSLETKDLVIEIDDETFIITPGVQSAIEFQPPNEVQSPISVQPPFGVQPPFEVQPPNEVQPPLGVQSPNEVQPPISVQPLSKTSHGADRIQLSVEPPTDVAETFSELGDSKFDSFSYMNFGFADDNEVETKKQLSTSAAKERLQMTGNWNVLTDNPDYSNC